MVDVLIFTADNISVTAMARKQKHPPVCELGEVDDKYTTINEQITKIAQNHPAIVKTSSSEAPCWISR